MRVSGAERERAKRERCATRVSVSRVGKETPRDLPSQTGYPTGDSARGETPIDQLSLPAPLPPESCRACVEGLELSLSSHSRSASRIFVAV